MAVGAWRQQDLPLAKLCCGQGSWCVSLGRDRTGTWGHQGDQHWQNPVPGTQGAALTAGYSQSIPCPWSQGSTDSPAQPVSLMGTHKDLMHLPDVPGYDLGP